MLPNNCLERRFSAELGAQMYAFIKELDQQDIDLSYGTASGGGSKMVRLPNGRLAANDADSQRAVAEIEQQK